MCKALLIADDDPGITELIERYIREHDESRDATISICHSIEEVWAFFEEGKRVDLVFLDLIYPTHGADDIIAMIPKLKAFCPRIIVISGYEKFRQAAMDAGSEEFLFKLGDMDTSKTFFEKVARFFRESKGPSPLEKQVAHLQRMIDPPATSNG